MKAIRSRVLRLMFVGTVCLVPPWVYFAHRFDGPWGALLAAGFYITTAYVLRSRVLGYMLTGVFLGFLWSLSVGYGGAAEEVVERLAVGTLAGLLAGYFVDLYCAVSNTRESQPDGRRLTDLQRRRPIG